MERHVLVANYGFWVLGICIMRRTECAALTLELTSTFHNIRLELGSSFNNLVLVFCLILDRNLRLIINDSDPDICA